MVGAALGDFAHADRARARLSPTFSTGGKKLVKSRVGWPKSPLHFADWFASKLPWCRDARRWLRRQVEGELLSQELLVGVEIGIAAQDQGGTVGGWEVHVEHLHGGELVEHGPGSEAGCQRPQSRAQRDVKAIGQKGDEDMSFDALFELMIDRTQLQIVFEILERGLDLDKLDIEQPELGRLPPAQIGAQEIAAFAPPHLAWLLAIESETERGGVGRHLDIDQT